MVGEVEQEIQDAATPSPPRTRWLVLAFVLGALAVAGASGTGRLGPYDHGQSGPIRACQRAVTDEVGRAVQLDDPDDRRLGDDWLIDGTADGRSWHCRVLARQLADGWQVLEVRPAQD